MAKRPRSPKPIDVSAIEGVREAPFPGFVPLCHPTLRTKLPEGGDWLYEAKLDGYRVQLHRHDGHATAYTRNGLDWSAEFAPICLVLTAVPARSVVLDGEVVVPGADGVPDFGAVRAPSRARRSGSSTTRSTCSISTASTCAAPGSTIAAACSRS